MSDRAQELRGRVLVVDDELAVQRTVRRVLAPECEVVGMESGRAALALLLSDDGAVFDVVLCELELPDLSGKRIWHELASRRWPRLSRLVILTAGALCQAHQAFLDTPGLPVLSKPFSAHGLRRAIALHMARVL